MANSNVPAEDQPYQDGKVDPIHSVDAPHGSAVANELQKLEFEDPGIVREFVSFLQYNKKWWLAPILIAVVALICVVFLATSPAAPFIYTLF
ncbi:hypothetical protein K227x_15330 [Rubripirellula lacrimiformis]|uniref:Uncharacterized protein n=1 Tax=Rubripirellula lacrimiformis TaxID=1930273 RepID=A0A517N7P9_9BACT|nr:DUF5989 family protein [Rubripirellula lacrimiformis]QDT03151.1 hypothetical protein K227x_15330 [Rubripirellula lacrimiformis]